MPISAVIHLSPPEDVTLRPTMGHHAHAVFLSLLRIGNPKKAEEAHATSAQKPFTVSPLIARGTRHRDSLHLQAGTDCKTPLHISKRCLVRTLRASLLHPSTTINPSRTRHTPNQPPNNNPR